MIRIAMELLKMANTLDTKSQYSASDRLTRIANHIIEAQWQMPGMPQYGIPQYGMGMPQYGMPGMGMPQYGMGMPQPQYGAQQQYEYNPTGGQLPQPVMSQPSEFPSSIYYNSKLNSATGVQEGSIERQQLTQATQADNIKQMISVLKRNPQMDANQLSQVMVDQAIKFKNSGQFQYWLREYINTHFNYLKSMAGSPATGANTAPVNILSAEQMAGYIRNKQIPPGYTSRKDNRGYTTILGPKGEIAGGFAA